MSTFTTTPHAAESGKRKKKFALHGDTICANGGCTKTPRFNGTKFCYRCWVGTKWTSIYQRVRDTYGNYKTWRGVPLGFSKEEFFEWVRLNPPPSDMPSPSIDRIVEWKGYIPGNIRWLDRRENSRLGALKQAAQRRAAWQSKFE